jgi:hypothetical protein
MVADWRSALRCVLPLCKRRHELIRNASSPGPPRRDSLDARLTPTTAKCGRSPTVCSEMRTRNVVSSSMTILACVLAAAIVGGLIFLHLS